MSGGSRRLPLAWSQSRDTICPRTHQTRGDVRHILHIMEWIFVRGCMIRGKYQQTTGSVSISAVNRIHLIGEKAIRWLSERLPVDFVSYATQMFDALYRSSRAACYINRENGRGVRLFEQHKVYVTGLDFTRNTIQIAFQKRRNHDEDDMDTAELITREYPMPYDENEIVPSLKVRWGDLLRAFAVYVIINLHESDLIEDINKLIRGKEDVILITIDTYDDIVVKPEKYRIDLIFDAIDDVYLGFEFEKIPFIQPLKITFGGNRLDLATFLGMSGYYSPMKGEGFLYDRQSRAFVVSLSGNDDEVQLEWKDAWIDLHEHLSTGLASQKPASALHVPLSVKRELLARARLSGK